MALLLDTSVLVTAIVPVRKGHLSARSLCASGADLALSTQTIREFIATTTRPREANGLGHSIVDAMTNLAIFRVAAATLLAEDQAWLDAWMAVIARFGPTGRSLFDAGQVAHAKVSRRTLVTDDARMVERYRSEIAVVTLEDWARG